MERLGPGDPQHVGAYRLLGRLGAGGMGQVYLARSDRGRTVAVKLVREELAAREEFRARFRHEVQAARRVGGHWTAPVLDADTEATVPWVATGYVAGPSLQQVVGHDHGPLPERTVRILAAGLAHALKDIHAAGIIHRDLKPSNVLLTIDGPRVIDFGIARALETVTDGGLTSTGAVIGSPGFMAPEQVRGDRVTTACDVFCLGSVLAYAATGALPFGGADSGVHALMFRIAQDEPDLERVPEGIADLVRDCLRKDPAARPTLDDVLQRTGADDTVADGRALDPWLPSALVAQLGRHAVRLLETENPEAPGPANPSSPSSPSSPASPAGPAATPARTASPEHGATVDEAGTPGGGNGAGGSGGPGAVAPGSGSPGPAAPLNNLPTVTAGQPVPPGTPPPSHPATPGPPPSGHSGTPGTPPSGHQLTPTTPPPAHQPTPAPQPPAHPADGAPPVPGAPQGHPHTHPNAHPNAPSPHQGHASPQHGYGFPAQGHGPAGGSVQPAYGGYAQPPGQSYGYPQAPGQGYPPPPYGGQAPPPSPSYTPTPYTPPQEPPRRNGRATALLIAVAVVVALGAGGSVYALMNGDDDPEASPSPTPGRSSSSAAPTTPGPTSSGPVTPSPSASTGQDGAIPTEYLGTWATTIDNADGTHTRRLTIQQGEPGDTVLSLTAEGADYRCVFEAELSEEPGPGGPLRIGPSTVTVGEPRTSCTPGDATEITLVSADALQRVNTSTGEKLTYTRQ
ncbi:serine/threonine protein kinase [Streptomyces glaucescens]